MIKVQMKNKLSKKNKINTLKIIFKLIIQQNEEERKKKKKTIN